MPPKPKSPDLLLEDKPKDLTEEQWITRAKTRFNLTAQKWLLIVIMTIFSFITVVTYGLIAAVGFGWASLPESLMTKLAWGALVEVGGWVASIVGYFFSPK